MADAPPPSPEPAAWTPLPLGLVEATGADAVRFVDNFTTAAVSGLAVGRGTEAFFTDARGQVLALTTILRTETGLLVATPSGLAAPLRDHLEHYHIREAVDLRDVSAETSAVLVAGPQAAARVSRLAGCVPPAELLAHVVTEFGGLAARIVRVGHQGPDGCWILAPAAAAAAMAEQLAAAGVPRAPEREFEAARLLARYPAAADIPPRTLPQELGRDARAISFTKGCYLGQETVARLDALGHVNRRLVLVAIDAAEPPGVPVAVTRDGAEVGLLTSACHAAAVGGPVGLAIVQVRALEAGDLRVAGALARVLPLTRESGAG